MMSQLTTLGESKLPVKMPIQNSSTLPETKTFTAMLLMRLKRFVMGTEGTPRVPSELSASGMPSLQTSNTVSGAECRTGNGMLLYENGKRTIRVSLL